MIFGRSEFCLLSNDHINVAGKRHLIDFTALGGDRSIYSFYYPVLSIELRQVNEVLSRYSKN